MGEAHGEKEGIPILMDSDVAVVFCSWENFVFWFCVNSILAIPRPPDLPTDPTASLLRHCYVMYSSAASSSANIACRLY